MVKIREHRGVMGAEWIGTADDGGTCHVVWMGAGSGLKLAFGKTLTPITALERFGKAGTLAEARKAAHAFIRAGSEDDAS